MISELRISEFRKRLAESTSPDEEFYIFTPYNFSGAPFCGTFDDARFELSRNSFWRHVKAIRITGKYWATEGDKTEVFVEIGLSKAQRIWIGVFILVVFVSLNSILVFNPGLSDVHLTLTINGLLVVSALWWLLRERMIVKRISRRFNSEFEIYN